MAKKSKISRRFFLRGTGAAIALPYLEAMMPSSAFALPEPKVTPRVGIFYFGMGMNMRQFTPVDFGPEFTMSRILKPLEEFRGKMTVLSGTFLEQGGGHKGTYPFATGISRDEKQGISTDQLAAEAIGQETRFPSIQMSVKKGTGFGGPDLATLSFNRQGVPLPAENDPTVLFDRLFRPPTEKQRAGQATEFRQRQSVLDLVHDDAARLKKKLSQADRQQLEQYFYSVRELEKQLERQVAWSSKVKPNPKLEGIGDYSVPISPDEPQDFLYERYAKLMYDLIALAFQTDSTRVITYVVRTELKGGSYPEWGLSRNYHSLTHHGNNPQNLEELAKADTIYMDHWAHFLRRLQSIAEGDGTLLDHSMLGFSSGMGIGHSRNRLPTVFTGGARFGVQHQGHLGLPENTPLANMWKTMLDRAGVETSKQFQDSTGLIEELIRA